MSTCIYCLRQYSVLGTNYKPHHYVILSIFLVTPAVIAPNIVYNRGDKLRSAGRMWPVAVSLSNLQLQPLLLYSKPGRMPRPIRT